MSTLEFLQQRAAPKILDLERVIDTLKGARTHGPQHDQLIRGMSDKLVRKKAKYRLRQDMLNQ
ncbi:hypothetical protein PG989_013743 [Apiospora arundinis]